ncbi:WASH complex subunit 1 [Adelges cooleyi]|uniref:WASH complex subunit 1 n=1 Tax=Adelges cooleyi TaxID=133065 RepID=UPI0021806B76|nr:WASH complex subunit 1 [Adelges cooleyi]XP_050427635.1 WASH complex subunit 1 [Adelges cooleyi]
MVKVNIAADVPLIPYDLGYEETLLQLIKSLDYLDKVVESVYDHVRGNIRSQKCEIDKLNNKLSTITNKVQHLSQINKSIQVYSSSKYPATHCHKDYNYSYHFEIKSDVVDHIEVVHNTYQPANPINKLKFYNIDLPVKRSFKNKDIIHRKGIGSIPDDAKYINSLLLFNSNENLYKNYNLSKPLGNINTTLIDEKTDYVNNLNRPVFTLPLNETENQFNYSYTPIYEEIPSIDVPADLPDLPGIAGDINYREIDVTTDLPVVCEPSSVVDLPTFDELDNLKNDDTSESSVSNVEENIVSNQEPTNILVTDENKEVIDTKPNKNEQNPSANYHNNINTHSVLMDEIRNAGGMQKAKLRPVFEREKSDNEVPPTEGLMADLHKKLAMRRQGISGTNKQNDSGLEGVIYRMASKMLPLDPESESEVDESNDTEGDWDD